MAYSSFVRQGPNAGTGVSKDTKAGCVCCGSELKLDDAKLMALTGGITKPESNRPKKKAKYVPPLFFDQLMPGAIENILHFLGNTRRHADADRILNVPAWTVHALLRCGGSLARVCRDSFRSVELETHLPSKFPAQCRVLVRANDLDVNRDMRKLLPELGESLKTLRIDVRLSSTVVRAIINHCSGLRSFSFDACNFRNYPTISMGKILAARGGSLEHLGLTGCTLDGEIIRAICAHCPRLKHLKLYASKLASTSLAAMWESLGEDLQEVELRYSSNVPLLALGDIVTHCPNISALDFQFEFGGHNGIEDICKHYGPKLLELKLLNDGIGVPALKRIGEACPNVQIDFPLNTHIDWEVSVDTAVALGPLASSWHVDNDDTDFTIELFTSVGWACPNLRTCSITLSDPLPALSESIFGGLYVQPKPKLQSLEISVQSEACIDAVLSVLIRQFPSLETFQYQGPRPCLELLKQFIQSQTRLKHIAFHGGRRCICRGADCPGYGEPVTVRDDNMGLFWIPIVATFLESRSLVDIMCSCKASEHLVPRSWELFQICSAVRARPISINVCDYQYL